jgi:hypothetical protein
MWNLEEKYTSEQRHKLFAYIDEDGSGKLSFDVRLTHLLIKSSIVIDIYCLFRSSRKLSASLTRLETRGKRPHCSVCWQRSERVKFR